MLLKLLRIFVALFITSLFVFALFNSQVIFPIIFIGGVAFWAWRCVIYPQMKEDSKPDYIDFMEGNEEYERAFHYKSKKDGDK